MSDPGSGMVPRPGSAAGVWDRFEHDPRSEAHAGLRASDRDRDVANQVLGTAFSEGRLTAEEFDERTDQVASARTLAELPPLLTDLVAPSAVPASAVPVSAGRFRAEAERRYRERLRNALWSFLVPTVICWIIWVSVLASGDGTWFPWPAFVTIGTGVGWVRLATSREDSITAIEHHLDKREQRKLERQRRREIGGQE